MYHKKSKLFQIFSKGVLFQIILVFFLGGLPYRAQAGVWGYDEANNWAIEMFDVLKKQIADVLVGVAKQAVGQIMNTQITNLVGGGGGNGPMFITNWQSFLVNDPQKQAGIFMNDFFTITTGGRNSSSNYRPAPSGCESNGFRGTVIEGACVINSSDESTRISVLNSEQKTLFTQEGIISTAEAASYTDAPAYCGQSTTYTCAQATTECSSLTPSMTEDTSCQLWCGGSQKYCSYAAAPATLADKNYYKYQETAAKWSIIPSAPNVDLLNYVSNPSEIFKSGSWRGFNAFFSNSANNPFGYSLMAKGAYQSKLADEKFQAYTQGVAYQGFKASVGSDGVTVKTPGITIGQIVDKVQGFSFDSIASAQGVGAIVQSVATTVISAVVTKGLNAATETVQGGINSVTGGISSATGGNINLNIQASSLANTNWNNSGSGQSSQFNNGVNTFNSDTQSNLTNNSQSWGDMNFSGIGIGNDNNSNQNSYSSLNADNFQSFQNSGSIGSSPDPFVPNTKWTAPNTQHSNDPIWNGDN